MFIKVAVVNFTYNTYELLPLLCIVFLALFTLHYFLGPAKLSPCTVIYPYRPLVSCADRSVNLASPSSCRCLRESNFLVRSSKSLALASAIVEASRRSSGRLRIIIITS